MEASYMIDDRWMMIKWYIHIQWNISREKEWNLAICDSVSGPWGYYSKWNMSDRERQIPYDFTYMWNLKNRTNEQTKQNRLIDKENKLVVARGRGGVMGEVGEGE